jgi:multidrug efflux pump subunit AcrA (membrane-fusion protein)
MQKKTSEDFWKKITIFFKANYLKLGFVLILLIVLPLPHKYRPAGSIKILSTQQKEIQADISGKITKINVEGGDGSWVKARTPIAEIEPSRQLNDSTPVYNDRLVKLEEINYQKALQQKAEAKLQQLLSTPRPEAVAVAQKELELAKQELEAARSKQSTAENELIVAQSQLQTGIVQLDFRERAAARLKELNQQGAIALQDYEDAEKLAETGRAEVEVQKNNVATKQRNIEEEKRNVESKIKDVELKTAYLSLVMSGPHPDEIMAARQDIEAISVEIKRLNQQLNYTTDQLKGHRLLMPFDGHITTPFLYQKVGTYIQQGQTFAVAEDDRTVLAEIEIPESDAEEFSLGAKTEIKLMAYPNTTIVGKVLNIEPTTKEEENGNFIRVRVEIPNPKRLLKSGMSGYAKIEGSVKPLFWVISRPLVRFIKVEVWSWIP